MESPQYRFVSLKTISWKKRKREIHRPQPHEPNPPNFWKAQSLSTFTPTTAVCSKAMASHCTHFFSPPNLSPKFSSLFYYSSPQSLIFQSKKSSSSISFSNKTKTRQLSVSVSASSRSLEALIFDCDGVILESEHLHRQAYNDAFSHFNVCCTPSQPLIWDPEFYDVLQNQIGGGKPKMRWYIFFFVLIFLGFFNFFS